MPWAPRPTRRLRLAQGTAAPNDRGTRFRSMRVKPPQDRSSRLTGGRSWNRREQSDGKEGDGAENGTQPIPQLSGMASSTRNPTGKQGECHEQKERDSRANHGIPRGVDHHADGEVARCDNQKQQRSKASHVDHPLYLIFRLSCQAQESWYLSIPRQSAPRRQADEGSEIRRSARPRSGLTTTRPKEGRSPDHREQPAPAHRPRPAPDMPGGFAVADRKENDLGFADEVLERHVTHCRRYAAVG